MKRWIAAVLALMMGLSLAACGGKAQTSAKDADAQTEQVTDDSATPDNAPDDSAAPDDDSATPDNADGDSNASDDAATPDDESASPDAGAALPDDSAAPEEAAAGLANPFADYATYEEAEKAAGFAFGVPEEIGGYDSVSYRVAESLSLFEVIYANDAVKLTARKAPGGWDISGDNNQYTVEVAETLAGADVTCWGDGDSLFLAMWSVGGYSYSLSASESVDRADFLEIVETVIGLNAE